MISIKPKSTGLRCYCVTLCIVSLFTLFFLTQCTTKNRPSIEAKTIEFDLDREDGPIPDVSIEKIIPLEMTENSTLSDTYGLNVKYYNNRFYVLDIFGSRSLLAFSDEGLFINRTKNGRGPGELLNPFAFDIDRDKKVIKLWDQSLRSMVTLDLDLNIISSFKLDTVFITDFRILNNDRILVNHNPRKENASGSNQLREYYQYTLYEKDFNLSTRLNLTVFAKDPPITLPNPFSIGDEILLIAPRDLNIYKLTDGMVEPAYIFDFGKYGFSQSELEGMPDNEKEDLERNGERIRGLGIIQKTNNFLMSIVAFKNQTVTIFHSLSTDINYNLNDCFKKNLLPDCFTQCSIGQNRFLALVAPDLLKTFAESNSEYADLEISENDNPYIIIYTIKEK